MYGGIGESKGIRGGKLQCIDSARRIRWKMTKVMNVAGS